MERKNMDLMGIIIILIIILNANLATAAIFRVDSNISAGTNQLFVDSSTGYVGIGTSSPDTTLHLNEDSSAANFLKITNTGTGEGATDGFIIGIGSDETAQIWQYENLDLLFGTNNVRRMTILAGGNVGIGTSSGAGELNVAATNALADIYLKRIDASIADGNSIGQILFTGTDGGSEESPQIGVTILGKAAEAWETGKSGTDLFFKTTPIGTNTVVTRMTILDDGNIGIGTDSPASKLHVVGDVNITSNLISQTLYDVASEGLVLAMNFNNASITNDGNTVLDSSGFNHHGTNNGAVFNETGGFNGGGAYEFNGTSSTLITSLNTDDLDISTESFTISLWINPAAIGRTEGIIGKGGVGPPGWKVVTTSTGRIQFILVNQTSGSAIAQTPGSTLKQGMWQHIVGVANRAGTTYTNSIYYEGEFQGSNTLSGAINVSNSLVIPTTNSGNYFNGSIDDIRIYKRALSAEEIKRLYLQRAEVHNSFVSQKDLTVDSSGNVGIGTTSPEEILNIEGTGTITLKIEDTGVDVGGGNIKLVTSRTGSTSNINDYGGFLNWIFMNNASTPEEIKIGDIYGLVTNVTDGSEDGDLIFREMVNGALTEIMRFNAGNVGIGTSSPQTLLQVGTPGTGTPGLRIASFAANQFWDLEPGTNTFSIKDYDGTALLQLDGANNYALFLGGKVGIGTDSPSAKLELKGDDQITTQIINWSHNIATTFGNATGGGKILDLFNYVTTQGGTQGRITWSADDGESAAIGTYYISNTDQRGKLYFATSNATDLLTRMVIDDTGNVGIGTTSPGARLEVEGDVKFQGNVTNTGQPGFLAYNSVTESNIDSDIWYKVEFDTEVFDQASNFNPATDIFTAPISGKYKLSASVQLSGVDPHPSVRYEIRINTSNRNYVQYWQWGVVESADMRYLPISFSVVADMDVGDTALVEVRQVGQAQAASTDIMGHATDLLTYFSGWLLG